MKDSKAKLKRWLDGASADYVAGMADGIQFACDAFKKVLWEVDGCFLDDMDAECKKLVRACTEDWWEER